MRAIIDEAKSATIEYRNLITLATKNQHRINAYEMPCYPYPRTSKTAADSSAMPERVRHRYWGRGPVREWLRLSDRLDTPRPRARSSEGCRSTVGGLHADRSVGASPAILANGAPVRTPPGDLILTREHSSLSVLLKHLVADVASFLCKGDVRFSRPNASRLCFFV
jgi:hypothetical protein